MLIVEEIRKDMMDLNALVMASILQLAQSHHPHQWAKNTGSGFGDLPHASPVTVVHGDVAPLMTPKDRDSFW